MREENEIADMWREVKALSREKRADNRAASARLLTQQEIPFTAHNGGAHLVVHGKISTIDFWPGTGRWIERAGRKGFGVMNLIKYMKAAN